MVVRAMICKINQGKQRNIFNKEKLNDDLVLKVRVEIVEDLAYALGWMTKCSFPCTINQKCACPVKAHNVTLELHQSFLFFL